jgi:excisionase family DNA binding protein
MAPGLQSRNRSRRLSTGQVARLLSVTPDTVLKWIKSGRLRAVRTAGGHYRVDEDDVDRLISAESGRRPPDVGGFVYCWEYYAGRHEPSESCQDCLVYRARARRCYEMSGLAREVGYSGAYCTNSCMECSYYQEVVQRSRRVLVVTESADLRRRLELESSNSRLEVAFANSEYECSAACNDFRPEYVVIDGSLSRQVRASLCSHLAVDPRIPGVQIILAVTADTRPGSTETGCGVDRVIPREFELENLEQHIIGLEVEPATTA